MTIIFLTLIGIVVVALLTIVACGANIKRHPCMFTCCVIFIIFLTVCLILMCKHSINNTNSIVSVDYSIKDNFKDNLKTIAVGIANGYNSTYFDTEIEEVEKVLMAGKRLNTFCVTDNIVNCIYQYINVPIPDGLLAENNVGEDATTLDDSLSNLNTTSSTPEDKDVGIAALLSDPNYEAEDILTEEELNKIVTVNKNNYRNFNLLNVVDNFSYEEKDNYYYKYLFTNKSNTKCSVTFKCDSFGCIQDIKMIRGDIND